MPLGGYSYQPGAQAMQQGAFPRAAMTPQEAVRILSLRLPKNPQNSPVPSQLLTSAGGGATSNLTQLLQALMQAARGGDAGSKELVSESGPPATVDPTVRDPRAYTPPRVVIGDQGRQPVVDPSPAPVEPIVDDSPLFDAGTPTFRNMPRKQLLTMGQPLF
jgi:hypothetical protein